jgi:hypothetical protein
MVNSVSLGQVAQTVLEQVASSSVEIRDAQQALAEQAEQLSNSNDRQEETLSVINSRLDRLLSSSLNVQSTSDAAQQHVEIRAAIRACGEGLKGFDPEDFRAKLRKDVQQELLPSIRQEMQAALGDFIQQSSQSPIRNHKPNLHQTAFELDVRSCTARLDMVESISKSLYPGRHGFQVSKPMRCTCRRAHAAKIWNYGCFGFKIENSTARLCPQHGKRRSYSITANLSPWVGGTVELMLGLSRRRSGWELAPPI